MPAYYRVSGHPKEKMSCREIFYPKKTSHQVHNVRSYGIGTPWTLVTIRPLVRRSHAGELIFQQMVCHTGQQDGKGMSESLIVDTYRPFGTAVSSCSFSLRTTCRNHTIPKLDHSSSLCHSLEMREHHGFIWW